MREFGTNNIDSDLAIAYAGKGCYVLLQRQGNPRQKENGVYQRYIILKTAESPSALLQEAYFTKKEKTTIHVPEIIEEIMNIEIMHYINEIEQIANAFEKEYKEKIDDSDD
jgi:hypothetical protein